MFDDRSVAPGKHSHLFPREESPAKCQLNIILARRYLFLTLTVYLIDYWFQMVPKQEEA